MSVHHDNLNPTGSLERLLSQGHVLADEALENIHWKLHGIIFYGVTLLVNRFCCKKSPADNSRAHQYQEAQMVPTAPVMMSAPVSRGTYAQPPSSRGTYGGYTDLYTDVIPQSVTVHTRL
eukprot:gene15013-10734_t